ncbi:DNA double-strand break repair Rad50 ATPase [Quillaja saponaria]|uniref:DNA double-strand break repair Rad50 ATPase n=1 Tax=Quillaja saponaria TaxID=32244 RepID=A0AAD7KXL1_QUISA|nr:DNA double-strand break repair Rad50 ATPase [Quillaja saponaria]KAJ7947468.1 DNA double-strand break repair Rad50 ATPase [Quillaja saponaria]
MWFYRTDVESILSQMKHQEKQAKLKRRWLLGIPTSKSERKQFKRSKIFKKNFFCVSRLLPESLLREDDMFYEKVKTFVKEAFGACDEEGENNVLQDDMELFDVPNIKRMILSCLDNLSIKGVIGSRYHNHHQVEIFKQLSQLLSNPKNFKHDSVSSFTSKSQSYFAAVTEVLDGLKDLPFQTLIAMYRKLKGVQGDIPQLQPRKQGRRREYLIKQVRITSEEMLSELDEGDELQEPLAKAMAVADLSLRLTLGCHNMLSKEFYQFSPEMKTLQNEIIRAKWLVTTETKLPVLKDVQLLLDRNAKISNGCLRTAVKKMLTDFLFECNDMDSIPKSLLEAVAVINGSSTEMPWRCFQKENIQEEADCILNVSAQAKQIVLDLLPDHELDEDFADAYMEELEESDDDNAEHENNSWLQEDRNSENSRPHSVDSNYRQESFGEFIPFHLKPSMLTTEGVGSAPPVTSSERSNADFIELQLKQTTAVNSIGPCGNISSSAILDWRLHNKMLNMDTNKNQGECVESTSAACGSNGDKSGKHIPGKQDMHKNQYLAIQEACDEISTVAYNLTGQLLEKFAKIDGLDLHWSDKLYLRGANPTQEVLQEAGKQFSSKKGTNGSVILQVVQELVPSFPNSAMERLKILMGL